MRNQNYLKTLFIKIIIAQNNETFYFTKMFLKKLKNRVVNINQQKDKN